ncbi:hypothetical protein FACS1894151_11090 [Spirochaetia bacterium]|nr:hypothetical protein FACS1894151_11090 [Spirochaetia bacterium]
MMNVKVEQIVWLLIGTLFTAGMLFFVNDSTASTSIAWTFTGIVGTFIGVDLAVMLKKTSELPSGQYKEINKHRYVLSLVIFAVLLAESFVISWLYKKNCDGLYASFGMGFLIIIGCLVAGVEGNKMITNKPDEETKE